MKKVMAFITLIFSAALMCGCSPVSVSELYSLPQLSDEYISLQALIDSEISGGSEYSPPAGGTNLQAVQQYDLNGDASPEALAFFRTGNGTLKICIYSSESGEYREVCAITGDGSSIGRVEYADMDGDGSSELIVAWQLDGGITTLGAYSLEAWSGAALLTANAEDFSVIPMRDEGQDLLILRRTGEGEAAVDMCSLAGSGELAVSTAKLSRGFGDVEVMRAGTLSDGTAALFVEGSYMDSHMITDVFAAAGGSIYNITATHGGISQTTRSVPVYSEDINGDGITEVPSARRLGSPEGDEFWAFDWKQVRPDGQLRAVMSTFHSYADGWYLDLGPLEGYELFVERSVGLSGRRVTFSAVEDGDALRELFSVYVFTGANREAQASAAGMMLLHSDESAATAMSVSAPELDADELAEGFALISSGWTLPAA